MEWGVASHSNSKQLVEMDFFTSSLALCSISWKVETTFCNAFPQSLPAWRDWQRMKCAKVWIQAFWIILNIESCLACSWKSINTAKPNVIFCKQNNAILCHMEEEKNHPALARGFNFDWEPAENGWVETLWKPHLIFQNISQCQISEQFNRASREPQNYLDLKMKL